MGPYTFQSSVVFVHEELWRVSAANFETVARDARGANPNSSWLHRKLSRLGLEIGHEGLSVKDGEVAVDEDAIEEGLLRKAEHLDLAVDAVVQVALVVKDFHHESRGTEDQGLKKVKE